MKEWVQIPAAHSSLWAGLAGKSFEYISTLPTK
jgi:hypothetical protein